MYVNARGWTIQISSKVDFSYFDENNFLHSLSNYKHSNTKDKFSKMQKNAKMFHNNSKNNQTKNILPMLNYLN